MKKWMPAVILTLLVGLATTSFAMLSPKNYEKIRIESKTVYMAKVLSVSEIASHAEYSDMSANLEIIQTFKGQAPQGNSAQVTYPTWIEGVDMRPGPTIYYRLKAGDKILVFADGFKGKINSLLVENLKKELSFYSELAAELVPELGQAAKDQAAMYKKILAFLEQGVGYFTLQPSK